MTGASGSVGDDSEPLEIQKHAPLQLDNIDMRINVLKEYISKVPDATLKDLKKSLIGYSKATDNEFKDLVKAANINKYNEIYPKTDPKPQVNKQLVVNRTITLLPQYTLEEVMCLEEYRGSGLSRAVIYEKFKTECPKYPRKIQFVSDYYHNYPQGPPARLAEDLKNPPKINVVSHTTVNQQIPITNHHVLAQAITSLYKSGKSPKIFSQIKPVLELINDPNEIDFAIECLTS
jgi:hypothetical protein